VLHTLRLQLAVADIARSRYPDAKEAAEESFRARRGAILLAFRDDEAPPDSESGPISRYLESQLARDPSGGGISFTQLCAHYGVEAGPDSQSRARSLHTHYLLWGKSSSDFPDLSDEEFRAAVAWGNALITRESATPLAIATPETLFLVLTDVFGCTSLEATHATPGVITSSLQSWLRDDPVPAARGEARVLQPPPGAPCETPGPASGSSPGSYFLNSLLTAGARWPIWDSHASELLQLSDLRLPPPTNSG